MVFERYSVKVGGSAVYLGILSHLLCHNLAFHDHDSLAQVKLEV